MSTETAESTASSDPTTTPEPTPEPVTVEDVVKFYVNFLDGETPMYWSDGTAAFFPDLCWDRPGARAEAIQELTVRDLTGDGLPELCAAPHSLSSGGGEIWTVREGRVEYLDGINPSYERILPNGGIFYDRPGAAPLHNDYAYRWLSPESRELPEIWFSAYHNTQDEQTYMDTFYIDDVEVTQEEWEERTAPYFALWQAEPTEEQQGRPFLDWAIDMGVDVFSLLTLEPWQEAYIQFLQEDNRKSREAARETESGYASIEEYYSIYDVNGDQVSELILCYWEFGRYYVNLYAFRETAPSLVGTFCIGRNGPFLYVCPREAAFLADLTLYGPDGTSHTWRKFTWKEDSLAEEELLDELIPWEEGGLEPVPGHAPTEAADLVPDAQPLELIPITEENIRKAFLPTVREETP